MLTSREIELIAIRVADLLRQQQARWLTTEEAASLIGVSPNWMRKHKNQFTHTKGDGGKGRLRFNSATLVEEYGA